MVTDLSYGKTVNYSCDIGYEINGTKDSECHETGRWSTSAPTCDSKFRDLNFIYFKVTTWCCFFLNGYLGFDLGPAEIKLDKTGREDHRGLVPWASII